MIIPPTRFDPLIDEKNAPTDIVAEYLEDVADEVNNLTSVDEAYTTTNVTTDRAFDADTVTLTELADILGTLISDLQDTTIIK